MKIALTTSGDGLSAPLDQRFGRAAKFLIIDDETGEFEIIENSQSINAAHGAGIQAAQNVAQAGAKALISGNCGPKAFRVLSSAGIAVYPCSAATVAEALEQFKAGTLTQTGAATTEGI